MRTLGLHHCLWMPLVTFLVGSLTQKPDPSKPLKNQPGALLLILQKRSQVCHILSRFLLVCSLATCLKYERRPQLKRLPTKNPFLEARYSKAIETSSPGLVWIREWSQVISPNLEICSALVQPRRLPHDTVANCFRASLPPLWCCWWCGPPVGWWWWCY